jgi:hypothetical protein
MLQNNEQEASVAIMKQKRRCLTFRRWLHEDLQSQLRHLYDIVIQCVTNEERDKVKWDWKRIGVFTVKSTYKQLCKNDYGPNFKRILKAKMPLKIKIFMWLVSHDAIRTKDNLCKRK